MTTTKTEPERVELPGTKFYLGNNYWTPGIYRFCNDAGDPPMLTEAEARAFASALRSSAAAGVPAGWKLVPEEPTEEMVRAASARPAFPEDAWAPMIAASPEPPAPRAEGEAVAEALVDEQELRGIEVWLSQLDEESEARFRARLGRLSTPRPAATDAYVEGLVKTLSASINVYWTEPEVGSKSDCMMAEQAIVSAFANLRADNARLSAELDALRRGGAGVDAELRKALHQIATLNRSRDQLQEMARAALDARLASDLTKGGA